MSKLLRSRSIEKVHECGREFYALCLGSFQQRWLQQRRADYTALRWRTIDQLTAFGLVRMPVRVVRERGVAQGGYFTLSKALLQPKATRLLSPWVEKRVGSSYWAQLPASGSRAMAVAAGESQCVVALEVRPVSRSHIMRATGARVAAGSGATGQG